MRRVTNVLVMVGKRKTLAGRCLSSCGLRGGLMGRRHPASERVQSGVMKSLRERRSESREPSETGIQI